MFKYKKTKHQSYSERFVVAVKNYEIFLRDMKKRKKISVQK